MLRGRILACSLLVVATSVVGCKRDLGECNLDGQTSDGRPIPGPAAFDIAYRLTDGLPMYEGQALVQSTCGDGAFCHAPAAVGADRIGVPAGLNFDVGLACTVPFDNCDDQGLPYAERLDRLYGNQNQINTWAEGMIQEMRAGAMPPGEAGRSVRNNTPWLRKSDGSELPPIESGDAQEIVRNWLACQAPVIARTEAPPSEALQLEPCQSVDNEICIYNGPEGDLPDPVWSDIYWSLMFTQCVICHGPSNGNNNADDPNPNNPFTTGEIPGGADANALAALDLSGANTMDTTTWPNESWAAVVNALTFDQGLCADDGTIVIPNNPTESIMIEKLRAMQTCGDSMPPGGSQTISDPLIQVVVDWINMGAPNN
ncbi:MAG: hypothetical protein JRI98_04750 [Deltaproteobacteria bacterium]|nr:hypothetical protein [Deltaproteobacteria bacterium]MBW1874688.1 hypothetical protein [Deltaproteobacteria bacterium]